MGNAIKLAVPTMGDPGLDSMRSGHFGRCDCFTLIDIEDGKITAVDSVPNPPHEQGGCMTSVNVLVEAGANALVCAGMGMRPMAGCREAGIDVYYDQTNPNVGDVAMLVAAGEVPLMEMDNACHHH